MELLNKIQQGLKAPKSQKNSFGNYMYRSCEDIVEAVKPFLGDGLLTMTDEVVAIGDRYYVKATAQLTSDGDMATATGFARETETKKGMDAAQITGAASSYARKYALNGLFCIDDNKQIDGGENGKTLPRKPNAKESEVLDAICEILVEKTNQKVFRDKVAAIFLVDNGAYPANMEAVNLAAGWLMDLNRTDEWAKPTEGDGLDDVPIVPPKDEGDPFPYHCNSCGKDFETPNDNDTCRRCLAKI